MREDPKEEEGPEEVPPLQEELPTETTERTDQGRNSIELKFYPKLRYQLRFLVFTCGKASRYMDDNYYPFI